MSSERRAWHGGDSPENADREAFMERFRHYRPHVLARGLNKLTPGTNWMQFSKGEMAQAWARARSTKRALRQPYVHLVRLSLDEIEAAVRLNLSHH